MVKPFLTLSYLLSFYFVVFVVLKYNNESGLLYKSKHFSYITDTDVSVLLHLEIPPGWDRDKIVQAVSSIRLHGNSAIKINAISSESLNIKVNVNSNLLSDPEELTDEIGKTMSKVFEESGVNTQETSEVNIEFMIPLETGIVDIVSKWGRRCLFLYIYRRCIGSFLYIKYINGLQFY